MRANFFFCNSVFVLCSYSLLGASGCGKTTALNCLAGRLDLDAGDVTVLSRPPGDRDNGVPGKRIGYMPQESYFLKISICVNLSIVRF